MDISRLAGLTPAGVICEIMKPDGTMARLPDLITIAAAHGMKIGTISDLIAYRNKHDNMLVQRDDRLVTSAYGGEWRMRVFEDQISGTDHVLLSKGETGNGAPVLARTHALNPLEDVLGLGSSVPDELPRAMQIIAEAGHGVVLLLREPNPRLRLDAEDEAPRTIKRTGLGAQILSSVGVRELILLTDHPQTKYTGLEAYNLTIVGTQPITRE